MNTILTLKEAAILLGYKDTRPVEKWCKKKDLEVFIDAGNNEKYIIRMQFEYARLKEFIQYLKKKHKEKWLDAFKIYTEMNFIKVIEIEEMVNQDTHGIDYQPRGKKEKNFLATLLNIRPK